MANFWQPEVQNLYFIFFYSGLFNFPTVTELLSSSQLLDEHANNLFIIFVDFP